ncbi:hypothetical protein K440DRAFT_660664, partial [Wilcoxina mikolae CBS 423.85]
MTTLSATSTTKWTAPTGYAALLAIANGEAAGMRPYPDGFVPPNFLPGYHMEYRGNTVLIVCYTSMAITALVATMRLVTRRLVTGWLGWDDWMIVPATIFAAALTVENITAIKFGGLGKHGWDLTYEEAFEGVKKPIPHLVLYSVCMLCVKLSILFFVRRLAGAACSENLSKVIKWFFVLNVTFSVSCWIMYICQCLPVAAGWNLSLRFRPGTVCKDYTLPFWITSAIHSFSDLALLALPIYLVLGLQMSRRKKSAVIVTFLIGGLAC